MLWSPGTGGRRLLLPGDQQGRTAPGRRPLWQEFLYSDEGQNLFLGGGARPVRADSMVKAGTIDQAAYEALPTMGGDAVIVSVEQNTAATEYLADNWARAIG